MTEPVLPSWRDGATKAAVVAFLDEADEIPPEQRVAVFDNDGTLWCEKPRYPQLDFFVWELRHQVEERPALREAPEYEALLEGDAAAVAEMGLERVALALVALFEGQEPEQFDARVKAFFDTTRHPDTALRYDQMVYQPMLELLRELEARAFTNCIVTGGGTEFVRAVSRRVYGIEPERVVGTLVTYRLIRRNGRPILVRTDRPQGEINEGE
ncbi:MAG: haloacid dehalogenase-like hydrolase, partial [Acidimicrobiia bacterium]|nr:haloacid dehalogenase-like hydrolase [Acidimicrobiia bacterium]